MDERKKQPFLRRLAYTLADGGLLLLGGIVGVGIMLAANAVVLEKAARPARLRGYPESALWEGRHLPVPTPTPEAFAQVAVVKPESELVSGDIVAQVDGKPARVVRVDNSAQTKKTPLDVIIILDTTGSMGSAIDGCRKSAVRFVEALRSRGYAVRVAGVSFGDSPDEVLPFTDNADQFAQWLDNIRGANSGEYLEENPLDAIVKSEEQPSAPGVRRITVVITDALAHEAGVTVKDDPLNQQHSADIAHETITGVLKRFPRTEFHTVSPPGHAEHNVCYLAEHSGGTSIPLPSDGNVELTNLPVVQNMVRQCVVTVAAHAIPGTKHMVSLAPARTNRFTPVAQVVRMEGVAR